MPGKADMLHRLPKLQWRGLTAPCVSTTLDGSHDQSPRRVPYVRGTGHDCTGGPGYGIRARIVLLETVTKDDFAVKCPEWFAALEDGSSGELVHPLRGFMRARPMTWRFDLDANIRSGTVLEVEWEETVDDFDKISDLTKIDIDPSSLGEAAEAAANAFDIEYPDGLAEPTLGESLSALEGSVLSAGMSISGKMNQVMGAVTSMVDKVDALDDPEAWPAHDNLVLLWGQLNDTKERIEASLARPVGKRELSHDTTLDAFATDTGNTIDEIMGLNLAALGKPKVAAGTVLLFYTS